MGQTVLFICISHNVILFKSALKIQCGNSVKQTILLTTVIFSFLFCRLLSIRSVLCVATEAFTQLRQISFYVLDQ